MDGNSAKLHSVASTEQASSADSLLVNKVGYDEISREVPISKQL